MAISFQSIPGDLFYPLSLTRSVADLRIGITTLREKWDNIPVASDPVDPRCLPGWPEAAMLHSVVDLLRFNDKAIHEDFARLTAGRVSAPLSTSNRISGSVFAEAGVQMEHVIINADAGPVYIGKNVTVMEGALLRGPIALCEGAVVKMGTRLYGASTIGPYCTIGGELKQVILQGYSNKAHDGYLGDAVIGEWCNLGAGTSNSNIKNTAGPITVQLAQDQVAAGQKFGLLMGDYSRAAINTSFNTGTTVGVCCNVFGAGLTPAFIPSFSWGSGGDRYRLDKAFADIQNWKMMKQATLSDAEKQVLTHIFDTL
jgi:UDP-N-acetylglucosamine diphosphorylase / glucose-1-phosphate thymidylyltransferase / UDP-N-acetylgalactosamine diphosphorylase / glucosamine-1-phosphate N-acetyltransferase / galactosamine-1-phosphate N-acetyltransferase